MTRFWLRFKSHRIAVAASYCLVGLVGLAVFAGLIESLLGISHESTNLALRYGPAGWPHLLGSDDVGRDVLSRLLHGGRISLMVGIISAVSSALIGSFIGLLAGYFGGIVDTLLMRFTDAMLAIPVLPLMIVFSAIELRVFSGNQGSVIKIIAIIVFFGWMTVARLARAAALQLKNMDYVMAARALGASHMRILLIHILPGALPPIVVAATLEVGGNILYEAALSFLGLGIQPPVPSWGNMLTNSLDYIWSAPMLAFWPGLLILVTVSSFNFLGDGLRDALDPHQLMRKS